jgi:phage/plasmid-associated DNA primase
MEPEGVVEATEEYRVAEDWLSRFLDENTEHKNGSYVAARKLYTSYCAWAKETKEYTRSERRFAEALQEKGLVPTKKTRRGKEQGRFYDGLELRDPLRGFVSQFDDMAHGKL